MIVLLVVVSAAIYQDIKSYKIPNGLIVAGWISGFILQVMINGIQGIGYWCFGSMLPIIVTYVLFYFKMLGAGDIKLLSVIGGMCGIGFLKSVLFVSFLVGAVLSLMQMLRWKQLQIRFLYFFKYVTEIIETKQYVPYYEPERDGTKCVIRYSIPIGIAVVICLIWQFCW